MNRNFKIETDRLILRPLSPNDFEALYDVLADSDIMRYYPYTFDDKRVRNWINKNIERYEVFGFGLFAVVIKETGEMIGDCGLTMQSIDNFIRPEIGYHIRKDMQRKGFAREAAIAVRDFAFENTTFGYVYSYMKAGNIPSIKTALSYGAKELFRFTDDENEISIVCGISRKEWESVRRIK